MGSGPSTPRVGLPCVDSRRASVVQNFLEKYLHFSEKPGLEAWVCQGQQMISSP